MAKLEDSDAVLGLAKEFATSFVAEDTVFRASFIALVDNKDAYLGMAEMEEHVNGLELSGIGHILSEGLRIQQFFDSKKHEPARLVLFRSAVGSGVEAVSQLTQRELLSIVGDLKDKQKQLSPVLQPQLDSHPF